MKKRIPAFKRTRAAAAFVDKADLSQFDFSRARTVRFEMKRKDKSINLRPPEELYAAVRQRATHAGLPYQRFIPLSDNAKYAMASYISHLRPSHIPIPARFPLRKRRIFLIRLFFASFCMYNPAIKSLTIFCT
jgi:predicted DNA binding CopG/RHH family protein